MEPIKLIKTEADYERALKLLDDVMDAEPGTDNFDRLELLAELIEKYEEKRHPIEAPSPIEAIRFVMDQRGLTQKDLEPYIGSRGVVSEVLNGKRPLTLNMIRALHSHLGIPADTLLQEDGAEIPEEVEGIDWKRFPLAEMAARGLIEKGNNLKARAEEIVRGYLASAGMDPSAFAAEACLRQGGRRNAKNDPYALQVWLVEAKRRASDEATLLSGDFDPSTMNAELLRDVAKLSIFHDGPIKAREYLASKGIVLLDLCHFRRTHLDGAAFLLDDGTPVVALTLRYDRLDNFWFTLLHELAHIVQGHVSQSGYDCIVDDLEINASEEQEKEADNLAQEAAIPDELWMQHAARNTARILDVKDLAMKAGVHTAIVAGRVRRHKGDYRLLSQHVGSREVRKQFE